MEFRRFTRKPKQMGLTSLIDVVFLLLIFFMLSTSFVKTESMELSFPNQGKVVEAKDKEPVRIFIYSDARVFLGEKELELDDLKAELRLALFKNPERPVLIFSGKEVSVQKLVSIMDDVYLMGGRNVAVANWKSGGPKVEPVEEMDISANAHGEGM